MGGGIVSRTFTTPEISTAVASGATGEVAFVQSTENRHELFRYEPSEQRTIPVIETASSPAPLLWEPSGKRLIFSISGTAIGAAGGDGETTEIVETPGPCRLWDFGPAGDSLYYTVDGDLWRYDSGTETEQRLLTEVGVELADDKGGCGPAGDRIAFNARGTADGDRGAYLAAADGQRARRVSASGSDTGIDVVDWYPGGESLLVAERSGAGRCGRHDLETASTRWFEPSDDVTVSPVATLPDGTGFLAARRTKLTERPVVCALDGTVREFAIAGSARFGDRPAGTFCGDSIALVPRETPARPREVLGLDIDTGEQVFSIEPTGAVREEFVEPRDVTFEANTGDVVAAHLFDSGARPSPALVQVYGAQPEWEPYFRPRTQYFVRKGFTVLQVEQPAPPFSDAEHENHAAAGRWLRDRSWIDEDRVVVFEHSHGGYDTYMQMVKFPEIWTAGIASSGATDLLEFHENAGEHHQNWLEEHLGPPDENRTEYERKSPLTHVDSFDGPLLVVHGQDDWLSVSHARRFRDALREEGFTEGEDFRLVELVDQGHVPETTDEKLRKWRVIDSFVDSVVDSRNMAG